MTIAGRYEEPLDRSSGQSIPNLAVTVYGRGLAHTAGNKSSLFSDLALTTPLANPLPTGVAAHQPGIDVFGNMTFYAAAGDVYEGAAAGFTTWLINVPPDGTLVADAAALAQEVALREATNAPVFNIKGYDALCDGVTDDHAAWVLAIAAASVNGGVVWHPGGVSILSARVDVPANVTVDGPPLWWAVVQAKSTNTGTGSGLFRMRGISNVCVQNLSLDGFNACKELVITSLPNATDIALRHRIKHNRMTNSTYTPYSGANPVDDFEFVDNIVEDCSDAISLQPLAGTISIGVEISRNTVRNIFNAGSPGIQIYSSTIGDRLFDVRVCDNKVYDCDIPIEINGGCNGCLVSGNLVDGDGNGSSSQNGISTAGCYDIEVVGNIIKNKAGFAIESNRNSKALFADNLTSDCRGLWIESSSAGDDWADLVVRGNCHTGSGLTASGSLGSITANTGGNDGNGLVIENNHFRGLEYLGRLIQIGVGGRSTNVVVRNNTIIADTANTVVNSIIHIDQVTDATVEGNEVFVTRNLVVGDDNARVIRAVTMGNSVGVRCNRNLVVFSGTIAAAPNLVGIGTDNAASGTAPRSEMIGNEVIAGPNAFQWSATSADVILKDNEGRSCTTEWANINAAVLFKRQQRRYEAAAAPATGAWLIGDIVWNTAPGSTVPLAWVCTVSGTPGTWLAVGPYRLTSAAIAESEVTNLVSDLALKAPLASPTFTGTVTATGALAHQGATAGFFNATPVAQISGSTDVLAGLVTLGLRAASANPNFNIGTGLLVAGAAALTGGGVNPALQVQGGADANAVVGLQTFSATQTGSWLALRDSSSTNILRFLPTSGDATAVSISIDGATGLKVGTATTQKLAFWNTTPIVQPTTAVGAATFVANAGTAVNDASTFDGYTMKQVVKALRNEGLLA